MFLLFDIPYSEFHFLSSLIILYKLCYSGKPCLQIARFGTICTYVCSCLHQVRKSEKIIFRIIAALFCVCARACACVCARTHAYVCVHTCACTHTCICTYTLQLNIICGVVAWVFFNCAILFFF